MSGVNFLQPGQKEIRHQIRGILESYTHDWDILAELCQNAVDAIRMADRPRGHIQLRVDGTRGLISCTDNGIGIPPKEFERLLRPFGTDKY